MSPGCGRLALPEQVVSQMAGKDAPGAAVFFCHSVEFSHQLLCPEVKSPVELADSFSARHYCTNKQNGKEEKPWSSSVFMFFRSVPKPSKQRVWAAGRALGTASASTQPPLPQGPGVEMARNGDSSSAGHQVPARQDGVCPWRSLLVFWKWWQFAPSSAHPQPRHF